MRCRSPGRARKVTPPLLPFASAAKKPMARRPLDRHRDSWILKPRPKRPMPTSSECSQSSVAAPRAPPVTRKRPHGDAAIAARRSVTSTLTSGAPLALNRCSARSVAEYAASRPGPGASASSAAAPPPGSRRARRYLDSSACCYSHALLRISSR